ncbi:PucR family transcriptional regulator [Ammoniphilus resinae]|uniref:Sugar diacid utilization regulator n=1 Tax=Ammoniphilus resinae TaxID=861532 RepID=A0ABS4GM36_9BACL|nr:helix-turn-helix domain-containing protein [Ammoniphilus resinae]MBP1931314.1 sugar diacid utilization regulator [Ammoniphilus resinae]
MSNDFELLVQKINEILHQQGELSSNHHSLEPGTSIVGPKSMITFALNHQTCLAYPVESVSGPIAQFISLLITMNEKATDQHSKHESFLLKAINEPYTPGLKAELEILGYSTDLTYLPLLINFDDPEQEWRAIVDDYFAKQFISAITNGTGYYLISLKEFSIDLEDKKAIEELGIGLVEILREEGFDKMTLSFTEPVNTIKDWKSSFGQAETIMRAGQFFHPEERIFFTWNTPLEVMLFNLPKEDRRSFIQYVLGAKENDTFDSEMYRTLKVFLQENLNISETARKLFIHRNTLIYRLEKFTAETGRDIRNGNEAFLVYLALLLEKGLQQSD